MLIVDDVRSIVSFPREIIKSWYLNGDSLIMLHAHFAARSWTNRANTRYLRNLRTQAYNWQCATGVKRPREDAFRFNDDVDAAYPINDSRAAEELLGPKPGRSPGMPENELSCNIWTSPFTLPTTVFKNTHQEQRKWS